MTSREEDKQHIIETMNRDARLSQDIQKLSDEAIKSLAMYLNEFANRRSDDGQLESFVLGALPDKNDQENVKTLVDEIRGDEVPNYDEADNLVNSAGKSYKINNGSYLLAVITLVVARMLIKTNDLHLQYATQEQNKEISYLTGAKGDLHGVAKADDLKKEVGHAANINDPEAGNLISNNYYSTVDTINRIYAKVNNVIKQEPKVNEFMAKVGSFQISKAVVSKSDMAAHKHKTVIPDTISGDLQRLNAMFMRNYRTSTSIWDRDLKSYAASKYGIDRAEIINEFGACNKCLDKIGKEYNVETAAGYLPQHYSCRCEMKLIPAKSQFDNVDSDNDD